MITWKNTKQMTAALLAASVMTGCSGGIPIVSEVRPQQGYTDEQTMILIATEKNRYETVYTDQIWQVEVDKSGTTFQTYLVGQIQDFLQELKALNLLADEEDISLTSQEKELLKELSAAYYESLTPEDLEYMGITREDVQIMYEEYHRANKLVDALTKDVNLEISDSEAKVIDVQEIRLEDEARAQEIYSQAAAEGADFAVIAKSGSQDSEIDKQVGRSERPKDYEDVVFQLTEGQISPVFQSDGSYYIVKCINDYNEEATIARKKQLSQLRKDQAFRQIYDQHVEDHPVEIGGGIWETVTFSAEEQSTTTNFFELYQEYMNY